MSAIGGRGSVGRAAGVPFSVLTLGSRKFISLCRGKLLYYMRIYLTTDRGTFGLRYGCFVTNSTLYFQILFIWFLLL